MNRSLVYKPRDSYAEMISTCVSRWTLALTSSWHLTISVPPDLSTRHISLPDATYRSVTAPCQRGTSLLGVVAPFEYDARNAACVPDPAICTFCERYNPSM